jgi:hypothetical protein
MTQTVHARLRQYLESGARQQFPGYSVLLERVKRDTTAQVLSAQKRTIDVGCDSPIVTRILATMGASWSRTRASSPSAPTLAGRGHRTSLTRYFVDPARSHRVGGGDRLLAVPQESRSVRTYIIRRCYDYYPGYRDSSQAGTQETKGRDRIWRKRA